MNDNEFMLRRVFLLAFRSDEEIIKCIKNDGLEHYGITKSFVEEFKKDISFEVYTYILSELNKRGD